MELEEMKVLWEEMSHKMNRQKVLTDKMIIQMTQLRFKNKLRAISVPENIGALICFVAAALLVFHFDELDTWYLQLAGIICITFCLVLPVLSLKSIRKMKQINITANTYKQSLIDYSKGKNQFLYIQKISFFLSFLFMLVLLPVMAKLLNHVNIFTETKNWIWFAPFGVPLFYFFSKWVLKKYKSAASAAEKILKELESELPG